MRTHWKLASFSLALAAGACNKADQRATGISDDLKRDLAAASTAGDLAPQNYQRMRFVSDIERAPSATVAKAPVAAKSTHRAVRPVVTRHHDASPAPELAKTPETAPSVETPVAVAQTPTPEPSAVISQRPSSTPVTMAGTSGDDGSIGERRGVGGLGGILGGIIGAVVIRGGHGGVDKCDPRTDGRGGYPRADPPMTDRPDYGSPFPRGGRSSGGRGW